MTRTHYGVIAGLAGAAFAAWRWWHGRDAMARGMRKAERGETIFSNAPIANP